MTDADNPIEFLAAALEHLEAQGYGQHHFRLGRKFKNGYRSENAGDALRWLPHYVCNALYRHEPKYRRAKIANTIGGWAILLDDVGTVCKPLEAAQPTWIVETSPDNFQHVYVLDVPVDRDALIAVAKACGGDAGSATCPRWMRLPGVPSPKRPEFVTRLVEFDPKRTWTLPRLVESAKLIVAKTTPKRHRPQLYDVNDQRRGNATLRFLAHIGLYRRDQGNGIHAITCPWLHEHSLLHGKPEDSGSYYFEPSKQYPTGGFKCNHAHCIGRNIRDLMLWLTWRANKEQKGKTQ